MLKGEYQKSLVLHYSLRVACYQPIKIKSFFNTNFVIIDIFEQITPTSKKKKIQGFQKHLHGMYLKETARN